MLDVIRSIAEQTNLLALNAAIGRRVPVNRAAAFAVVAPTRYAPWRAAPSSRRRRSSR